MGFSSIDERKIEPGIKLLANMIGSWDDEQAIPMRVVSE
jgi:hypothetical protein